MTTAKQVDKDHYRFESYMGRGRWNSLWHQVDEVIRLRPETVLEIGPGKGMFKSIVTTLGITINTLDIATDLNPDIVASVTKIPVGDKTYDAVCAFQVLEHLPYDQSLIALREMVRVAKARIVISLPDARPRWDYTFHVPKLGRRNFQLERPFYKPRSHSFDGEHYWEINKKGFEFEKVKTDFAEICALEICYRANGNPYHRFFVFEK